VQHGVVQALDDDVGRALRATGRAAEGADGDDARFRRTAHQSAMSGNGASNAGAVDMGAFLAAERVERIGNRIGEFGVTGVDAGVDHGDRHIHAVGQHVRLRQLEFRDRILRGITFGGRPGVLQQIAEIELHVAHARDSRKRTALDVD
jgi:hypothetical protein